MLQTDSLHNCGEHYQQRQMELHSYPLPSNSSYQLTLPLTRSLYHSSTISPLQTSLIHTNNRWPSTLYHEAAISNYLPVMHRDEEQQQQQQPNYDAEQLSRRHTTNRRCDRNRKCRKHKRTSSDRSKSRYRDVPSRRSLNASFVDTLDCESKLSSNPGSRCVQNDVQDLESALLR